MAALPELWHICVFIEAGGMELGKLGGVCGGKCVRMVVFQCVCTSMGGAHVRARVGGSHRGTFMLCMCVCQEFGQREGGRAKTRRGESEAARERGKLQIRLYLQISCQKEPFKGNAPVPAL